MTPLRGIGASAVAEGLGTFALCFIGAGAVCMNQWTGGALGLLGVALAHGAVLAAMVSTFGHLSGGHFNPAVTLGVLTLGRLNGRRACAYILAQLAGSVAAAFLLRCLVPEQAWQPVHLGAPTLGAGVTIAQGVGVEAVLTFFLVLAVCGTAVDPQGSWSAVAGFGIGAIVAGDILVGGPITGAAMNPARAFGPALASGFWDFHLIYWLGPLTGGALAAYVYASLFLSPKNADNRR